MNALLVCLMLAAADAGPVTVVAPPMTVAVSGAPAGSSSMVSSSMAAPAVDAGKAAVPSTNLPVPADSDIISLVIQFFVALKSKDYLAASFIFGMLVLWLAQKLKMNMSAAKKAPVGTVTPAASDPIVPPVKPENK